MLFRSSDVAVTNSFLSESAQSGIYVREGAQPTITNNVVTRNRTFGIQVQSSGGRIESNQLIANGSYGLIVSSPSVLSVIGNTIVDNEGNYQAYISGAFDGTDISNNSSTGFYIYGTVSSGTFNLDEQAQLLVGRLAVADGAVLNLEDTVVKFVQSSSGINISSGGTLTATNTVFTSYKDDNVGGDSNGDGSSSVPGRGNWNGIHYAAGSSGALDGVTVRYGGLPTGSYLYTLVSIDSSDVVITNSLLSESASSGISVREGAQPTIKNNVITRNQYYGVYASRAGALVLRENSFSNNSYAVFNSASPVVDAINNYWGDDSGPTHADNPAGLGGRVSNNVDYTPWIGMIDQDEDGIADALDNCIFVSNADQQDIDGDNNGDLCDDDIDGDGVANDEDAFPEDPTESIDTDGDGIGDNTDLDDDGDSVDDLDDNCPLISNPSQSDVDGDGIGDACDELGNRGVSSNIVRVSVSSSNEQANEASINPSISADGRYVVFESQASNLVSGDANNTSDVFIHDVQLKLTQRLSLGDGASFDPAMNSNASKIVFTSAASNLTADDTNDLPDVFLTDRITNTTAMLSVGIGGVPANGESLSSSISADGASVAFVSYADNLITNDVNGYADVFKKDNSGAITVVSVNDNGDLADAGSFASVISPDGRYIAFETEATNLSASDNNGLRDVYLHDTNTNMTTLVSVNTSGSAGNLLSFSPGFDVNSQYVTFTSRASDLVTSDLNNATDWFAYDIASQSVTRISQLADGSDASSHSTGGDMNGDLNVFSSFSDNLVANDENANADLFLTNNSAGMIQRINKPYQLTQTIGVSSDPHMSLDQNLVVFTSSDWNLVPNDDNRVSDIFIVRIDGDTDFDGIPNLIDNCPDIANSVQEDFDGDSLGDACDLDDDNDGVNDSEDALPFDPDEHLDTDLDGIGNNADTDDDGDNINDDVDNCSLVSNEDQLNTDNDAQGNACDLDDDNDGVVDQSDAFPLNNLESRDWDNDGIGDNADPDDDNDLFADITEVSEGTNPFNANSHPPFIRVFEDAQDANIVGWAVSDNDPMGATITNIVDTNSNATNVISLSGNGLNNEFSFFDSNNDNWVEIDRTILQWSFNYSQDMTFSVVVETEVGQHTLNYTTLEPLPSGDLTNHWFSINPILLDGQWHAISRDIKQDLLGFDSNQIITNVNYFSVKGPGLIDDIKIGLVGSILPDHDGDAVENNIDNCVSFPNSDQINTDGLDDGGDACDADDDNDGVGDVDDAFPLDASESIDSDGDGIGNNADADDDNDQYEDNTDCAPLDNSKWQILSGYSDADLDGYGSGSIENICSSETLPISHADNNADNCPTVSNADQLDVDEDGVGDACDTDVDNDGIINSEDCAPTNELLWQLISGYVDVDGDGFGFGLSENVCSGETLPISHVDNDSDNCSSVDNPDQIDTDSDGFGDICDLDDDEDGITDEVDNCPLNSNPDQLDENDDGIGDVCESDDCDFFVIKGKNGNSVIICL